MAFNLKEKLEAAHRLVSIIAGFSQTKLDDEVARAIKAVLDSPIILALLEEKIDKWFGQSDDNVVVTQDLEDKALAEIQASLQAEEGSASTHAVGIGQVIKWLPLIIRIIREVRK